MPRSQVLTEYLGEGSTFWKWKVLDAEGSYYEHPTPFQNHVQCEEDLREKRGEMGPIRKLFLVPYAYQIGERRVKGFLREVEWDTDHPRASRKYAHYCLAFFIAQEEGLSVVAGEGDVDVKAELGLQMEPLDTKYQFARFDPYLWTDSLFVWQSSIRD